MILRSQPGWRICAVGTGTRHKMIGAILVFSCKCVRRLHSTSSLFSVVFLCLILPTQEFILEKSAKIVR
ncbi:unnamed protein product, partial [Pocillopora meandrina]